MGELGALLFISIIPCRGPRFNVPVCVVVFFFLISQFRKTNKNRDFCIKI